MCVLCVCDNKKMQFYHIIYDDTDGMYMPAEPTKELLELLASEFDGPSAGNVRVYFGLCDVADLWRISEAELEIAGRCFLDTSEEAVLRKLCEARR